MKDTEIRQHAKAFVEYWKDKGYEKGESQAFWLSLLRDVLGVAEPEKFIRFEEQVMIDHTSFIDGHISATHVLIEQKSRDKDLRKPIKQSDGSLLNPFQQAQRYSAGLPYSQRPRWIITCNFTEFLVYDMENPKGEPEQILLKDLEKEYYRLKFITDTGDENIHKEMEVSIQAGNLVGVLYDEILKQYRNPEDPNTLKSLNMLCVRLVFCLYAEDAGIFGEHSKFHNYIKSFSAKDMRKALIELFKILNQKPEDRDPYEDEMLLAFPYVNGGLFAGDDIEIPQFNDTIRDIILRQASEDFDWSDISPTIFGAVFESTLNPETRRSGGMHYTSIENIHKVIDPLFLDELREELAEIKEITIDKTRTTQLKAFQDKISNLTFFDPACGSGNFLTETYISLRRLENDVLRCLSNQITMFTDIAPIKVSIGQFYGIEINDFAVTVAKTALWIAESQMMKETEDILHTDLDFLPLKSYANITEGNALRIDWETVVPKDKLNYIMGNPPFVGARLMSKEQKDDLFSVFGTKWKNAGNLDYVACWYKKAVDFMLDTKIRSALVSTNSVSQGEQVPILWNELLSLGVNIIFAHHTFRWDSEASMKAHVHCVIIGFS
ncbi:MAG: class I SAM-dependent DNA methyltransferase, partial [Clostridia bacterium]|nr:class I SAM-dependent DNA methyltransferase [Clostridia bacterium]